MTWDNGLSLSVFASMSGCPLGIPWRAKIYCDSVGFVRERPVLENGFA